MLMMPSPFIFPLAAFFVAVVVVAIVHLVKVRDTEIQVHQQLWVEELKHQSRMRELESKLAAAKQGR